MFIGVHVIVSSIDAEKDRAFLRDVLGLSSVDAGGGWPIYALPAAEGAIHPAEANGEHELYLMVADVDAFVARMRERAVLCTPIHELHWGRLVRITLPGGGELGVYQPLHPRPPPPREGA